MGVLAVMMTVGHVERQRITLENPSLPSITSSPSSHLVWHAVRTPPFLTPPRISTGITPRRGRTFDLGRLSNSHSVGSHGPRPRDDETSQFSPVSHLHLGGESSKVADTRPEPKSDGACTLVAKLLFTSRAALPGTDPFGNTGGTASQNRKDKKCSNPTYDHHR